MRPILWQAAYVIVGVAGLALVSALFGGSREAQPPALVVFFGVLYVAVAALTRRRAPPGAAWGVAGLRPAAVALCAGVALQILPHLLVHPHVVTRAADWRAGAGALAGTAVALTFCAVLWEELWFRNPVLNLVAPGRPQVVFSLVNGLLFAALHLLNPKFDAVSQGPELVLAGVFLTLAYFVAGTFHVPLALHLGNNVAGSALTKALGDAGAEAADTPAASICRAGLLLAGAVVLALRLARRAPRAAPPRPTAG